MSKALRGPDGRFVKGTGGGPGRKPKVQELAYLDHFKKAVTPASFEKASRKLLALALDGDVNAIRLLFAYALGNPVQRIDAAVDTRSLSVELTAALEAAYSDDGGD
jgi:hypothetical protein